jgi:hypothetical protein
LRNRSATTYERFAPNKINKLPLDGAGGASKHQYAAGRPKVQEVAPARAKRTAAAAATTRNKQQPTFGRITMTYLSELCRSMESKQKVGDDGRRSRSEADLDGITASEHLRTQHSTGPGEFTDETIALWTTRKVHHFDARTNYK